jgi:hypothetical protein
VREHPADATAPRAKPSRRTARVGAAAAFAFVFTMGIVNLFGDTTYEGGAAINGQFLGSLGASASALFSPFVFLGSSGIALIGMLLWGIGYAVQDTLFKAVVADRLPEGRRNFAFGIFYTGYGVGWLIGSIATGLLYGVSVVAVNPGGPTAPGPIPAPR